jgi:hypothetical protein
MNFSLKAIEKRVETTKWRVNPYELTHKQYSRCFVTKISDIEKVEKILKRMSSFEYHYMPSNWIQVYKGDPYKISYHGKFDPKLETFYKKCEKQGIKILIIECSDYDYLVYPYD